MYAPLYRLSVHLAYCIHSIFMHASHTQIKSETVKVDAISDVTGDVQKKITPWSNPASVLNELFPKHSPHSLQQAARMQSNLVLVASLLHKAPNLGGKNCIIYHQEGNHTPSTSTM